MEKHNREIGQLTVEEMQSLMVLQKLHMDLLTSLGQFRLQMVELEEKEKIVLQKIREEIPRKEDEFRQNLSKRLGFEEWTVTGDGRILASAEPE